MKICYQKSIYTHFHSEVTAQRKVCTVPPRPVINKYSTYLFQYIRYHALDTAGVTRSRKYVFHKGEYVKKKELNLCPAMKKLHPSSPSMCILAPPPTAPSSPPPPIMMLIMTGALSPGPSLCLLPICLLDEVQGAPSRVLSEQKF